MTPAPQVAERKHRSSGMIGNLFGRLGRTASPPKQNPVQDSPRPTEVGGAESSQGLRQQKSPADKFNGRWNELMNHLTDEALKDRLSRPLANGEFKLLEKELAKLINSPPDETTFALSQSLARGLVAMDGNYKDVRAFRPKRAATER